MDGTAATGSDAMGKWSEVLDSRPRQQICDTLFGSSRKYQRSGDAVPNAPGNGVCERFMGSLRRECLDHILIQDDRHLERITKVYTAYFNQERQHQGIEQRRIPDQYELPRSKPTSGRISSKAILGGLHHSYSRMTYLN
jgi:hypothetical protein